MKDRRREMIPIDKIKVINSRTRDEAQFALNVQSIDAVGQIKDIRVNDKFLHKEGFYELICGEGWDFERIATVACRSAEYVRQYIRLVENGEERLIHGVEHDVIPISFAIMVAQSDDANVRNVLMDAFDQGLVTSSNFAR